MTPGQVSWSADGRWSQSPPPAFCGDRPMTGIGAIASAGAPERSITSPTLADLPTGAEEHLQRRHDLRSVALGEMGQGGSNASDAPPPPRLHERRAMRRQCQIPGASVTTTRLVDGVALDQTGLLQAIRKLRHSADGDVQLLADLRHGARPAQRQGAEFELCVGQLREQAGRVEREQPSGDLW